MSSVTAASDTFSAQPGITRPPQLLGPNDVGVSEIQREFWLHLLAPAWAGRPALFGDLFL